MEVYKSTVVIQLCSSFDDSTNDLSLLAYTFISVLLFPSNPLAEIALFSFVVSFALLQTLAMLHFCETILIFSDIETSFS